MTLVCNISAARWFSAAFPDREARTAALTPRVPPRHAIRLRERVCGAAHGSQPRVAIAELYRSRGLSTDTAVEAGFVVHLGLGVVKGLYPDRRIRRVLIVGPGMDLAPRTGFRDTPPESYQPWAVIDALVSTGLCPARRSRSHCRRHQPSRRRPPPPQPHLAADAFADQRDRRKGRRHVFQGLSRVFRRPGHAAVVARLGACGAAETDRSSSQGCPGQRRRGQGAPRRAARHRHRAAHGAAVRPGDCHQHPSVLRRPAAGAGGVEHRRDAGSGGLFLHNEARPILGELTAALGLPFEQSRHAVIATVTGAPAPLFDSVFLHVRSR